MLQNLHRTSTHPPPVKIARRARKIAHRGKKISLCAIFLARRAILTRWRMGGGWVEDGWRFGGGSEAPHFFQMAIYQYLTKKFCLRVEDGGTKRKKISETVNSNLKVDYCL